MRSFAVALAGCGLSADAFLMKKEKLRGTPMTKPQATACGAAMHALVDGVSLTTALHLDGAALAGTDGTKLAKAFNSAVNATDAGADKYNNNSTGLCQTAVTACTAGEMPAAAAAGMAGFQLAGSQVALTNWVETGTSTTAVKACGDSPEPADNDGTLCTAFVTAFVTEVVKGTDGCARTKPAPPPVTGCADAIAAMKKLQGKTPAECEKDNALKTALGYCVMGLCTPAKSGDKAFTKCDGDYKTILPCKDEASPPTDFAAAQKACLSVSNSTDDGKGSGCS